MSAAALLCVAALGFRIQEPESGEEGESPSETATPFPPPSPPTQPVECDIAASPSRGSSLQAATKIFLLTFVSPQFAAKMFPPKGGRVAAHSRTALHQVPNAILGVLLNVIA